MINGSNNNSTNNNSIKNDTENHHHNSSGNFQRFLKIVFETHDLAGVDIIRRRKAHTTVFFCIHKACIIDTQQNKDNKKKCEKLK